MGNRNDNTLKRYALVKTVASIYEADFDELLRLIPPLGSPSRVMLHVATVPIVFAGA